MQIKVADKDPVDCKAHLFWSKHTPPRIRKVVLPCAIKPMSFAGIGPSQISRLGDILANVGDRTTNFLVEKEISHQQEEYFKNALEEYDALKSNYLAEDGPLACMNRWGYIKHMLEKASAVAEKNRQRKAYSEQQPHDLDITSYVDVDKISASYYDIDKKLSAYVRLTFDALQISTDNNKSEITAKAQAPMTLEQWEETDTGIKAYTKITYDEKIQSRINALALERGKQMFQLYCAANEVCHFAERDQITELMASNKKFMEKGTSWIVSGVMDYSISQEMFKQQTKERFKEIIQKEVIQKEKSQQVKDFSR